MTTWEEMPDGTEDIREAFAAELERMEREPYGRDLDGFDDHYVPELD